VSPSIAERLARLDWAAIGASLDEWGHARTPVLLTPAECAELRALYTEETRFRSRVDMARLRFGVGEYKYFADPLPTVVGELREHAYAPLAAIANRWEAALKTRVRHPADLTGLLALCARRGQTKPTPLLLHYLSGGYNCLHQDLYGEVVFPIQLTVLLSEPGKDFEGESSCSSSSGHARSRAAASSIWIRARPSSSPPDTGRWRARAATTAATCATA